MKRIRSILLMLVLLLSMSIPAFAEGIISTDEGSNSASKKVTINYDPPAQITGVSITVMRNGKEVQPSNGVYCILPDSTVTLNVTGINLRKATNQNLVNYSAGFSMGFEGIAWTISEDGKSASKEVAGSEFAQSTSAYTITYTNDNDTWISTDVVVRYDDGKPAVINGVSIKVTENGAEVPPENGVYTVKSTSKVTLSITGTNLHRPEEHKGIRINSAGVSISLRDEGWSISEDWKNASIVLEGGTFKACENAYELEYWDSQSNWIGTKIFIQYDAGPKAEITGVSIKVTENGTEVQPENGVYLISPTSKVILTSTGTNLQNGTSSNVVYFAAGRGVDLLSSWIVNEAGTSASYPLVGADFNSCTAKYEIFYTNGDSKYVDTGLFVRYDDGKEEEDKAVITDVTVKVGEESYTSGTVILTPSSDNVTITIKGTNFKNLSQNNMLYYARGIGVSGKGLNCNLEENTAEIKTSLSNFEQCTEAWKIQYSNDGGTTRVDTNISILYRADVTSVDLSWGSMNFTYSDAQENGADKGWSCEAGANKITVTNNGTVKVSTGVSYRQAEDHTEITGSFDQETQTLAKDETKYFVFTLSGKPSSALENAEIGAVTVEITKAEE